MRIVFIQFGDYLEAWKRFRSGGGETFQAQRHSVDYVEELSRFHDFVATICVWAKLKYVEQIRSTFYAAAFTPVAGKPDVSGAIDLLAEWQPTHIVLRTPNSDIIRWSLRKRIRLLPVIADSFESKGVKARLKYWLLGRLLNDERIPFVANHNIPACLSLSRIGVSPDKILPWDWPQERTPDQFAPRTLTKARPSILYVGTPSTPKGVADLIGAAALLSRRGLDFTLDIVGDGAERPAMTALTHSVGLAERARFHGLIPHDAVYDLFRACTLAVVPSRPDYPEGLPSTIYEALVTRTPLVVSDHPIFQHYFREGHGALTFKAGDEADLADKIAALLADVDLRRRLSIETANQWHRLQCGLQWSQVINAWLSEEQDDIRFLRSHALSKKYSPPN